MAFEFDEPSGSGTNRFSDVVCVTCGGDRFVLVRTRPVKQTPWMELKKKVPAKGAMIDEYSACPDCNISTDTSFYRHDGSRSKALDPARVREMMYQ